MIHLRLTSNLRAAIGSTMLLLLLAGCAQATAPATLTPVAIPEVMVKAADYAFDLPDTVTAGWVRLKLVNVGSEAHHLVIRKLNEGVSQAQFTAALAQGEGPAFAMTTGYGGVGGVVPAQSAQAVVKLDPGQYVLLCLLASPADGKTHASKGMLKVLTVTAANGPAASEPSANVSVKLKDFAYDMQDPLSAGHFVFKATNEGTQDHEMVLVRVEDPGKTINDVVQFAVKPVGPPPFARVGGLNGISKGQTGFAEADLAAGRYMFICNFPDPTKNGLRHIAEGMIKEFSVK